MEYDESVYNNLLRSLVCTHKELTRFPFKNCEIGYGEIHVSTTETGDDDDINSYCSVNSVDRPGSTTSPNPAATGSLHQANNDKGFFLVYKNVNSERFSNIREQQRKNIKTVIEKAKFNHKDVLQSFKEIIRKVRQVKKERISRHRSYVQSSYCGSKEESSSIQRPL